MTGLTFFLLDCGTMIVANMCIVHFGCVVDIYWTLFFICFSVHDIIIMMNINLSSFTNLF